MESIATLVTGPPSPAVMVLEVLLDRLDKVTTQGALHPGRKRTLDMPLNVSNRKVVLLGMSNN